MFIFLPKVTFVTEEQFKELVEEREAIGRLVTSNDQQSVVSTSEAARIRSGRQD
jgi:hypothetical protein